MLQTGIKYSNAEVMEYLNVYVSYKHKEHLYTRLDKLGYEYKATRGGFIFTKVPAQISTLETEEEKQDNYESVVKDFIAREIGRKTINDNIMDYALHFALYYIDLGEEVDYNRSTYKQKKQMIENVLMRETVKETTLGTWARELMKKNILVKTTDKDLFCTYWVNREKKQLNIDTCEDKKLKESSLKQYKAYSKDRTELLKEYNGDWTVVTDILLKKYNCVYYRVPAIFTNVHFMEDDWFNFLDACSFWLFKAIDATEEKTKEEKKAAAVAREERIQARKNEKERVIKEIQEQASTQKTIEVTIKVEKKAKVQNPFEQPQISAEQKLADIKAIEDMMRELEAKKQALLNN